MSDGSVGYAIGEYDSTLPLVIDPVLEYASYFGGSHIEEGVDIAVDSAGNTYIVGNTTSLNLPVAGAFDDQYNSHLDLANTFFDVFVTKLDPSGSIVYSTYLGGGGGVDAAGAIAVNDDSEVYVVGGTVSSAFPTTVGAFQPDFGGTTTPFAGDGFITKLDTTGAGLVYSSYLGGTSIDGIADIFVDSTGAAYVVGGTESIANQVTREGFPTTPGVLQDQHSRFADPASPGPRQVDGFVTKVAPDGRSLVYSTFLGGVMGFDTINSIQVNDSGQAFVAGLTESDGLPTPGGAQQFRHGGYDAYFAILNPDATAITYGTYLGGGADDWALDLATDSIGRTTIVGWTESNDLPVVKPLQSYGGSRDGLIATFTADGTLEQSTFFGSAARDEIKGVAVEKSGHRVVVGETESSEFRIIDAVQPIYGGGRSDGFVTRLDAGISGIVYATFLGGRGEDRLNQVVIAADGAASVIGTTASDDLRTVDPTQPAIGPKTVRLQSDALLARIAPAGFGTITVQTQPIGAQEGVAFDGLVATFTDTGSSGEYTATIDWGDGEVSFGVVAQSANGRYRVNGSHLYERYGIYPVLVEVRDARGRAVSSHGTSSVAAEAGFIDYQVTIDTAALAGTSGMLGFQFNPAAFGAAPTGEVRLFGLRVDGGSFAGDADFVGGVAESIAGDVTITNSAQLNRMLHPIGFGDRVLLDIRLSGDMIADPTHGSYGSTLVVQLLADDGVTPLLSEHESGAILSLDVLSDGATRATAHELSDNVQRVRVGATHAAIVTDGPLSIQELPLELLEGVEFSGVVATFADGNPFGTADEFSATIQWGDGSLPTAGIVARTGAGQYSVSGEHLYANIGRYPLVVSVTSTGGATTMTTVEAGIAGLQAASLSLVGGNPTYFDVADFDNDGNRDIIAAKHITGGENPNSASILFGRGDGTFDPHLDVSVGTRTLGIVAGDFNNDGFADFISNNDVGGDVHVVLGNGDRSFVFGSTFNVPGANRLGKADLNSDGNLDLIVTTFINNVGYGIRSLLGNGDGTLTPASTFAVESLPTMVDATGDGRLDIVTVSNDGQIQTFKIRAGVGDGMFAPPIERTAPRIGQFGFGDMNGDDRLDLVLGSPGQIHVLLADEAGNFLSPFSYPARTLRNNVRLVDFDGDGDLDVIGVESGNTNIEPETSGAVDVFLNQGDGVLASPSTYAAPARPQATLFDDFNDDGNLDIAALESVPSSPGSGLVSVALGVGDGTIVAPVRNELAGHQQNDAFWLVAGDLDGDGDDDVVIATLGIGTNWSVASMLSDGPSTFGEIVDQIPFDTTVLSLTLGDVNHDDILDLIVTTAEKFLADPPREGVHVLLGAGDGSFGEPDHYRTPISPSAPSVANAPQDVALGDVDGDTHIDMVVGNANHAVMYRGLGDGSFAAPMFVGFPIKAVAMADFNADGNLDVATTGVTVAMGLGDGTFPIRQSYPTVGTDLSVKAADVNGDGKIDIVTSTVSDIVSDSGGINVLIGIGDGTFESAVTYASGFDYGELVLTDLSGDGRLDIALVGGVHTARGPVGLTVLYNQGNGTFGTPLHYETGAVESISVVSGFFDDDSLADLVVSNGDDANLAVITNRAAVGAVQVRNAPITVSAFELDAVAGVPFIATVATLQNLDTLALSGDHLATVLWGDGNQSTGQIISDPLGGFRILGSHTFANTGSYEVTVSVSDDGGAVAEDTATASVGESVGNLVATGNTFAAWENEEFITEVATFTVNPASRSPGNYVATIQWGDGHSSPGSVIESGNQYAVLGRHNYAEQGLFDVEVLITGVSGVSAAAIGRGAVQAGRQPLVATDDDYELDEDMLLNLDAANGVLANDDGGDVDSLSVNLLTNASYGLLVLDTDGSFQYTPNFNYNGMDTFTYEIADEFGRRDQGQVTIVVHPVNDSPVANDDRYDADEGVSLVTTKVTSLLRNDVDVDGDKLSVSLVQTTSNGRLSLNPDGSFVYTPDPLFDVGLDRFTYRVFDGNGGTTLGVAEIMVTAAGIIVTPHSGLATSEDGGTTSFQVALTVRPLSTVTVQLFNTDPGEGSLSATFVEFSPSDWAPRVVSVAGFDDSQQDGDAKYHVVTAWAKSLDRRYHGINPDDVVLINVDNELSAGDLMKQRMDVNRDGNVTAVDALLVINRLGRNELPGADVATWDINQNGTVSAVDALMIINELSRVSSAASPKAHDAVFASDAWRPERKRRFRFIKSRSITEGTNTEFTDHRIAAAQAGRSR